MPVSFSSNSISEPDGIETLSPLALQTLVEFPIVQVAAVVVTEEQAVVVQYTRVIGIVCEPLLATLIHAEMPVTVMARGTTRTLGPVAVAKTVPLLETGK